jgi:hypothetical protein
VLSRIGSGQLPDGSHCQDIFSRRDTTFGFEEFRGETDDGARRQSLGRHGSLVFVYIRTALAAAPERVLWLGRSESWR